MVVFILQHLWRFGRPPLLLLPRFVIRCVEFGVPVGSSPGCSSRSTLSSPLQGASPGASLCALERMGIAAALRRCLYHYWCSRLMLLGDRVPSKPKGLCRYRGIGILRLVSLDSLCLTIKCQCGLQRNEVWLASQPCASGSRAAHYRCPRCWLLCPCSYSPSRASHTSYISSIRASNISHHLTVSPLGSPNTGTCGPMTHL